MKAKIFTIVLILAANIGLAQIPVTDAAAGGQLTALNQAISQLNIKMRNQNNTAKDNKYQNYLSKIINQDNLNLAKQVEDYYWKVDGYLKQGKEINEIYDKEEIIIQKMKQVQKIYKGSRGVNVKELTSTVNNVLNQTMGLVDLAASLVSDDNYRLSTEERRQYLKELMSELNDIEQILDEQLHTAGIVKIYQEQSKQKEIDRREFEKSLEKNLRK